MIYIKSKRDIELIKQAAAIWKETKKILFDAAQVGISLKTLDEIAANYIESQKATCSFYQYNDFPGHICISVNDQLIHGVPNDYVIQPGDLIKFDVGVTYHNHVCDAAFTKIIAPKSKPAIAIEKACWECLDEAIKQVKPNHHIGDVASAIEVTAKKYGYEVIKDYGGHGCGNHVHEDPIILNYGQPNTGIKMVKGMVLCIEPMLLTNSDQYYVDPYNDWTVISCNHQLTCHCEHMVLVTDDGCEVLTA